MNITQYIKQIKSERKQIFFKKALSLGIQINLISQKHRLTKFSLNDTSLYIINDMPSFNTTSTVRITRNKEITKLILTQNNISTPKGIETDNTKDVIDAIANELISYPLVIKPIDAAKGVGINMNILNTDDIEKAVQNIRDIKEDVSLMVSDNFIAEELFSGNDYRVLIFDGKVIGCVNRIPAHIIGNGTDTIAQLIKSFNSQRPLNYLLNVDDALTSLLQKKSYNLDTVLPPDTRLNLREHANISSGGAAVDYTNTISDRFKQISIAAAAAVGGVFVGIDLFTDDITADNAHQPYTIIEINGAPDYDIHESPIIPDSPINISKILLQYFFTAIK